VHWSRITAAQWGSRSGR